MKFPFIHRILSARSEKKKLMERREELIQDLKQLYFNATWIPKPGQDMLHFGPGYQTIDNGDGTFRLIKTPPESIDIWADTRRQLTSAIKTKTAELTSINTCLGEKRHDHP